MILPPSALRLSPYLIYTIARTTHAPIGKQMGITCVLAGEVPLPVVGIILVDDHNQIWSVTGRTSKRELHLLEYTQPAPPRAREIKKFGLVPRLIDV